MTEIEWVFAALVTIGSVGRLARLISWDEFPPAAWVRAKYEDHASGGWEVLMTCGYCVSVYLGFGIVCWGYFTDFHTVWWLINGSLAASYAGAILMAYDGDDD